MNVQQHLILGIIYIISGAYFTVFATISFLNTSTLLITEFLRVFSTIMLFALGIVHVYQAGKQDE